MTYQVTVNEVEFEVTAPGMRRLLDVLREELGLTGTKEGCGEGECGACTVLLDGEVVDACLVPICQADGRDVRTVEGLADMSHGMPVLSPLQTAFLQTGGAQCGICTPGMIMAAQAFLFERAGRKFEDRRSDRTGADGDDADAVAREIECHRPRQGVNGALRGDVA